MMYQVFLSILQTFLVFGVGALAWKFRMIGQEDLDKLSRFTLDMLFPMLTFSTITRNFKPDQLTELWLMPLLGFALMVFGAGAGWVFKRLMKSKGHGREGTFHHICAINNYVFLPIIVLQNIYGDRHVALLLLMNVGSTVGFWTIGVLTFTGGGSLGKTMKSIFSINIAAVAAALLVSFLHIPLPTVVKSTVEYLGNITVPLMLVVIGVALVNCFRGMLENWYDMRMQQIVPAGQQTLVERNRDGVAAAPVQPLAILLEKRPVRVKIGVALNRNAVALLRLPDRRGAGAENIRLNVVRPHPQHAVPEGILSAAPLIEGEPSYYLSGFQHDKFPWLIRAARLPQ